MIVIGLMAIVLICAVILIIVNHRMRSAKERRNLFLGIGLLIALVIWIIAMVAFVSMSEVPVNT